MEETHALTSAGDELVEGPVMLFPTSPSGETASSAECRQRQGPWGSVVRYLDCLILPAIPEFEGIFASTVHRMNV